MDNEISQQVEQIMKDIDIDSIKSAIDEYADKECNDVDVAIQTLRKSAMLFKQRKKLHKVLCSAFSRRFPDLKLLVSDFHIYARAAKHLATNNTIDNSDFKEMLTQQQVVSLSLGLSGELGPVINSKAFFDACDLQIELHKLSNELNKITSNVIRKFAPNLCALIGPEKTAELVSFTGGVKQLAMTPACNIKMLGNKKVGMQGFSSRSTKNYQGVLYYCDIVQETTPEFRDATFRELANKVALVARIDSSGCYSDGNYGAKIKTELKERIDKKLNNKTPKYIRPLPIPGLDDKKPSRGGRQKRANKLKFGLGEELTNRQKVAFGVGGQFDELGEQFGKTALESFRKKKSKVDTAFQQKIDKKLKAIEKSRK